MEHDDENESLITFCLCHDSMRKMMNICPKHINNPTRLVRAFDETRCLAVDTNRLRLVDDGDMGSVFVSFWLITIMDLNNKKY